MTYNLWKLELIIDNTVYNWKNVMPVYQTKSLCMLYTLLPIRLANPKWCLQ